MIHMNVDGNKIKGDSTVDGFKDEIQIHSVQWGVGASVSMDPSNQKRTASKASISELTVTKTADNATGALFQATVDHTEYPTVVITLAREADKAILHEQKITLSNVIFSAFSQSSGGDTPSESLSLNFTKFKLEYVQQKADNTKAGQTVGFYDVSTVKGE